MVHPQDGPWYLTWAPPDAETQNVIYKHGLLTLRRARVLAKVSTLTPLTSTTVIWW